MSLKYGLPLIFGSIGAFSIASMFEEDPDVDISELAPVKSIVADLLSDKSVKLEAPANTHPIPAPTYTAPVFTPPTHIQSVVPYSSPEVAPAVAPVVEPILPPPVAPKVAPVVAPILPSPVAPALEPVMPSLELPPPLVAPPVPPKRISKPRRVLNVPSVSPSSTKTSDPISIRDALERDKSITAAIEASNKVKAAANKRADELRTRSGLIITKPIPNPNFIPPVAPVDVLPVPNKAKLRVRGYSETDTDLEKMPPLAPNAINIDAAKVPLDLPIAPVSPIKPIEKQPKIKQDGGNRKLKELARDRKVEGMDLYDRY